MKKSGFLVYAIVFLTIIMILESVLLFVNYKASSKIEKPEDENVVEVNENEPIVIEVQEEDNEDTVFNYVFTAEKDCEIIYDPNDNKGYRYGPSIIKYDDGTMDMWMTRPGNSSTAWDYIAYMHYDGVSWSDEETVLKPTSDSKDQCSVCDPAVIYFGGYYYLGYTGTDDYDSNGMNNSAFVARSKYPDGPFEKWNGSSWSGDPYPIIENTEDSLYWGVGELSFVVKDEELLIYYTVSGEGTNCIKLSKAPLHNDWPLEIVDNGVAINRSTEDSYDVVYDEKSDVYLAFSIIDRMTGLSDVIVQMSKDGMNFNKVCRISSDIEGFAHNMGIAKDTTGHINTDGKLLIGYAHGKNWGSWSLVLQKIHTFRE